MTKIKSERIFKKVFFLSMVAFVSCVGLKFYLCNSITVKNSELDEAFKKKAQIEENIERLNTEDAKLSSLTFVEKRARELGFVEMTDRLARIDLDAPAQVALLNSR